MQNTDTISTDPPNSASQRRKVVIIIAGGGGSGKVELATFLAVSQEKVKMAIGHNRLEKTNSLRAWVPLIAGLPYENNQAIIETTIKMVPTSETDTTPPISQFITETRSETTKVNGSILLLCIPVDQPESIRRVNSYWLPQLVEPALVDVPAILVGTKSDLRNDTGNFVSVEKAQALAKWIGAVGYQECSSITQSGLGGLLEMIGSAANLKQKEQQLGFAKRKEAHSFASNCLKVVLVGDGECGKNCLARTFCEGQFPDNHVYQPTPFEQYRGVVSYVAENNSDPRDLDVPIALWVTAGKSQRRGTVDWHDRFRVLAYPDSDVLLLCFAVDDLEAPKRVAKHWTVEVRLYCPKVPIILVGLKTDLRSDEKSPQFVSRQAGHALAKQIGAVGYLECSAKNNDGNVASVFQAAVKAVFDKPTLPTTRPRATSWLASLIGV